MRHLKHTLRDGQHPRTLQLTQVQEPWDLRSFQTPSSSAKTPSHEDKRVPLYPHLVKSSPLEQCFTARHHQIETCARNTSEQGHLFHQAVHRHVPKAPCHHRGGFGQPLDTDLEPGAFPGPGAEQAEARHDHHTRQPGSRPPVVKPVPCKQNVTASCRNSRNHSRSQGNVVLDASMMRTREWVMNAVL